MRLSRATLLATLEGVRISRRKCSACKNLLIETDNINNDLDVRNTLVLLADRGGLSTLKQYCHGRMPS